MRTYLSSNHEVAQAWAWQEQGFAKTHGALSFMGEALRSYSTVIGWHLGHAVIVTTRRYSVTTANHISMARSAAYAAGLRVIELPIGRYGLPNPRIGDWQWNTLREKVDEDARAILKRAVRARKNKDRLIGQAHELITGYNDVLDMVFTNDGGNLYKLTPPDLDVIRQHEEAERRNREADIALWQEGKAVRLPPEVGVYLRVNRSWVETSLGRVMDLAEAQRLYRLLRLHPSLVVGQKIGGYRVRRANQKTIRIGCHVIQRSEIERLARKHPDLFRVEVGVGV